MQKLKGNEGAALITALLFLVMLTLLGVAAIWTSSTETSLGGNERLNKQAHYLAEAGLQEAIARLDFNDTANPAYYIDTDKTAIGATHSVSAWSKTFNQNDVDAAFNVTNNYDVSILPSFEGDGLGGDFHNYTSHPDGVPADQLVLYNQGFGYLDSPIDASFNATGGFPVFHVTSVGKVIGPGGNIIATSKILADITKNTIDLNTKGGLVANGCTNISGSSQISAPAWDTAVYTTCMDNISTSHITSGGIVDPADGAVFTDMSSSLKIGLSQLRSMATISYTGGSTESAVQWGDFAGETNPQIVFVDNACKYSGTGCHPGKFSVTGTSQGFGILIVTGDLHIAGTFDFKGLVYVLGNLDAEGTGGPGSEVKILGSVVVGGTADYNSVTGNSSIQLDRDVLMKVAKGSFTSKIISWREIRE